MRIYKRTSSVWRSKLVKKIICATLAAILLLSMFSGCQKSGELTGEQNQSNKFSSFTDIPGVTEDEINNIEMLREKYDSLVYGVNLSTEAFYNSDGKIEGFSALFCDWLTELFDIRFEPTMYEWDGLIEGLESLEIDFTGELTATPARRKTYFMTDAIAERTVKLIRLENSMSLMEISEIRPLRYAFLTGTTTIDDVIKVEEEKFEPFYVNDYESAYNLLQSKKIDAFLEEGPAEAAFDVYGDIVASDFFPLIYSPVSMSTQNSELQSVISVVQKALENGSMRYLTEIYNQGHLEYTKHKMMIKLTEEEIEYLRANPVVKLVAEHDNYPVSFYDGHNKVWQGIAFDIMNEIENLTGLSFERVNDQNANWADILKMLESGEASMITELIRSGERENYFLWSKAAITTDYYALLSKEERRNVNINEILYSKIALIKNTSYAELFKTWFPNHMNTVEYENNELAFDALISGDVDMVMSSQNHLYMLTNYYELPGYKANIVFERSFASTFGFNKNEEILCSIVGKALELVDRSAIANQWTRKTYDYRTKLAQSRLPWLIGASVLLMCVLILLFVLFQRNRSAGKKLEKTVQNRTSELQHALIKLEAVMNNYKGIIWSVDKNGIITTFNGQYLKAIGVEPAFLEGKNIAMARLKNRHLDIIENVQKTFDEGPQDWIGDIDGGVFHSCTIPIYDSEGNITGVVGSTDDVTETIKLQQDLKTALESAKEASAAKSVFLANMSHEIRTPMNAIIGMTSIGKSAADSERKDYCFTKIQDASQHLLGIINDILDMSKIEANKFELSPADFNFEKMLQRVVNVVNFKVDEKAQKFTVHIDKNIPGMLYGDDQRLAQVITNLLGNAVKFTPEEGTIILGAEFLNEENGFCEIKITVTDTGIGISPEQQARLFTSFQQAESSTTRKFGGSGLGLSISKSIVEMMGGKIWVESETGKGSDFIFTVKMKRGENQQQDSVSINWKNIRILTVDDDPDILEYFKDIMREFNVLFDTASSGAEALELVGRNGMYDIYFIDWKMPEMNGIELSHLLRSGMSAAGHSVIIMISAADWNTVEDEAKEAGINKFLSKPLFPSVIFDAIEESLGAKREQPEESQDDSEGIFNGYNILLAEDVEINREIVLTLLEPTMLNIDCAENGEEAVRMFNENPGKYDMIFMDIQMPVMDGYEATRRIRKTEVPQAQTIPIVAMTANVFREDVEKSREVGMNDHVGKPLDFDTVLEKLRLYLPKRY